MPEEMTTPMPLESFAHKAATSRHGVGALRGRAVIRAIIACAVLGLAGSALAQSKSDETSTSADETSMRSRQVLMVPTPDSVRGRKLFVNKGCVVCHSVNGVGGKAGPALDASEAENTVDVFEFAARMWRGASVMLVLQEMELGYQIEFSGGDLADLAGFAGDIEEQRRFSEDDIPDLIKDWNLDEIYEELDQMAQ